MPREHKTTSEGLIGKLDVPGGGFQSQMQDRIMSQVPYTYVKQTTSKNLVSCFVHENQNCKKSWLSLDLT